MTTIRITALIGITLGFLALVINALRGLFLYSDVGVALFVVMVAFALAGVTAAAVLAFTRPPSSRVVYSDAFAARDFADEAPTLPYAPRLRGTLVSLVAIAALVVAGCEACGHAPNAGDVVKVTAIDCLAENQESLASTLGEMVLAIPDWSRIEDLGKAAGIALGGCAIAKLVRQYLAPAGGRAAPDVNDGHLARDLLERARMRAGGSVVFRTEFGDL